MSNAISFQVETQTEDNQIISLAYINEKLLAIEVSRDANILFKNNEQLFNKINASTKLLAGKLTRHLVTKPKKFVNRCAVEVNSKYEYEEEEILKLKFELGNLVKTNRVLFQGKKKIDYDPRLIAQSPKKNILDPDNITIDDLLTSDFVCSGEELFVFSRVGVKTFMFTDNLSKKDNLSEVSYELELTVDTDFSSYIDFILSKLQDSIYFLENYFNG